MNDDAVKVIGMFDSVELEPGGSRDTTIVRFMIGKLGPYEVTLDRGATQDQIVAAINARKASIPRF